MFLTTICRKGNKNLFTLRTTNLFNNPNITKTFSDKPKINSIDDLSSYQKLLYHKGYIRIDENKKIVPVEFNDIIKRKYKLQRMILTFPFIVRNLFLGFALAHSYYSTSGFETLLHMFIAYNYPLVYAGFMFYDTQLFQNFFK
jgi:hypothetical protein